LKRECRTPQPIQPAFVWPKDREDHALDTPESRRRDNPDVKLEADPKPSPEQLEKARRFLWRVEQATKLSRERELALQEKLKPSPPATPFVN